jgi:succinate dehydrogenase / fumarate reductase membrane anchor subunit
MAWVTGLQSGSPQPPLFLWFCGGVLATVRVAGTDYAGAVAWLHTSLLNPVLLVVLTAIAFWHMHAGLRVVVEDYVHAPLNKTPLLLLDLFLCSLTSSLAVFSILRVAFGSGAS